MKITEVFVLTGEIIERAATESEIAQAAIDETNEGARLAALKATATAKVALLERLGITADEAALLIG
jgi:hypothetical protein